MVAETTTTVSPTTPVSLERRQRIFSGIKPSGSFHLGNYLGAIRNWVDQQTDADSIFCVVDLHALSLPIDQETMRQNIVKLGSVLLASGLDPARCILFVQSDVREHTELCWLLSSVTQYGELRRMTQFKDRSAGHDESVSAALFLYPVLQAADIILYDADLVPVGEDQKQHVELTRDIAHRFNQRYGETFVLPRPDIKAAGARVMALDDPAKKMSKSATNPASYIALEDEPDVIRRKVRRAVTDSGSDVVARPEKPALTNLLSIYALLTSEPVELIEQRYAGKGYGAFKSDLAEVVVDAIGPIQRRLADLEASPDAVLDVLRRGADEARAIAAAKMVEVRHKVGTGTELPHR